MDFILLLAEIDWTSILQTGGLVTATGAITTIVTLFFTRRKERAEEKKVTFDTLLTAIKDRLEIAENKITTLQTQLDQSDKEILRLTIIITEQKAKIELYEVKINHSEKEAELRRELEESKIGRAVAEKVIAEKELAARVFEKTEAREKILLENVS